MHILSWHQVDLAGVLLAGLIAGYVMALAGLWAGAVPGLVAFDIADFGRRYMVSDRPVPGCSDLYLIWSIVSCWFWCGQCLAGLACPDTSNYPLQLIMPGIKGEGLCVHKNSSRSAGFSYMISCGP